jgi:putative transposase
MLGGVSRPLRLEHAGAIWHVTSRGNEKQAVYRDDIDRQTWLRLLGRVVVHFGWRLHGYVLMNNHYHLIAETPTPSLSRGMRQLNGIYTQTFNRRHQRVGHLFQGRFHSVLVQKESHLLELLRYVVFNPVRAGLVDAASDWRWSSYRATAGEMAAPQWLQTSWTLAQFEGSRDRYREFVAEGRGVPVVWRELRGQIYLGSAPFVLDALSEAERRTADREIPRTQREAPAVDCEQTLRCVLDAFAITPSDLTQHPRRRIRERGIVAYVLRRFARATCSDVASILEVSPWHASTLARAGEKQWALDTQLAASIEHALRQAL